jgi:hypothetical protein
MNAFRTVVAFCIRSQNHTAAQNTREVCRRAKATIIKILEASSSFLKN